jgi:glycosyltransferase involved in cell wall biosynthesis
VVFGQFNRTKGHVQILDALCLLKQRSRLGDVQVDFVGPGVDASYVAELKDIVNRHGLESNVKIEVGFFAKSVTIPRYRALIVASEAEAFGRVIVEAGLAGIPVIVRETAGGAKELVHAKNGLTYRTVEELAELLVDDRKLPIAPIEISYNMEEEIKKLIQLIEK